LSLQAEGFVARHVAEVNAVLLLASAAVVILQARNPANAVLLVARNPALVETTELARSVASGHGFTLVGVPSAHCAPLFPLILAALLKVFGDGPAFSYSVTGLEILIQWATILLLPVLSRQLLNSRCIGYLAAVAVICVQQISLGWEASMGAVFLEIAALGPTNAWLSGILMGLGTLLSPVAAVAILIMHFRWNRAFVASLGLAVLLCSPWTIRNYAVFHRFIPIRDNFGIALRLSYNPLAPVTFADPQTWTMFLTYEPAFNPALRPSLTTLGEAAFYEQSGQAAQQWIRSAPRKSLKLVARRVIAYWLPRDRPFLIILTLMSFAAIWISRRDTRIMRLAIALLVVFPLPYYIMMVAYRYRVPTLWFTGLLAGLLVSKLLERSFEGRARAMRPGLVDTL
jgi:hypothetical protein